MIRAPRVSTNCVGSFAEPCVKSGIEYEHGDKYIHECHDCTCSNGNLICLNIHCEALPCPESEQVKVIGVCCKYCKGEMRAHPSSKIIR